jgi:sulfatase maturation enzyme AslB (radical SAM superfamily)
MAAGRKLYPPPRACRWRDLVAAVVPLARNVASMHVPDPCGRIVRRSPPGRSPDACNLGCAHCALNRPRPDELTHAQRLEVAHRLARSHVWGVSLIGGEPLLVDGLFEYAAIAQARR